MYNFEIMRIYLRGSEWSFKIYTYHRILAKFHRSDCLNFFAMPSWSLDLFCKAKKVSNLPFAIPYYKGETSYILLNLSVLFNLLWILMIVAWENNVSCGMLIPHWHLKFNQCVQCSKVIGCYLVVIFCILPARVISFASLNFCTQKLRLEWQILNFPDQRWRRAILRSSL